MDITILTIMGSLPTKYTAECTDSTDDFTETTKYNESTDSTCDSIYSTADMFCHVFPSQIVKRIINLR